MCPNTLHYVVTMEDAFLYGRHFFSTSTVQNTACGIVHCFIMSRAITNDLHDDLGTMLRRMMAMWHVYYYDLELRFSPPQDPHIPNLATVDGLLDCIAVGNVLELAQVLDRRAYLKAGIHGLEQQEMAMARWRYRLIQKIFAKFFVTVVGGRRIHPMSIFRRSLMEFAVAVFQYKQRTANTAPKVPGCNPTAMESKLKSYFQSNYPELLFAFHKLFDKGVVSFTWSGPPIEIRLRTKADQLAVDQAPPSFDFPDFILYESADVQHNASGQSLHDEDVVMIGMNEAAATQASQHHSPPMTTDHEVAEMDEDDVQLIERLPSAPGSVDGDDAVSVQSDDQPVTTLDHQGPASITPITSQPELDGNASLPQPSETQHVAQSDEVDGMTMPSQQSPTTGGDVGMEEATDGLAEPMIPDVAIEHGHTSPVPQHEEANAMPSHDVENVETNNATEDDEAQPDYGAPSGK
jgi:hypothetical protein